MIVLPANMNAAELHFINAALAIILGSAYALTTITLVKNALSSKHLPLKESDP